MSFSLFFLFRFVCVFLIRLRFRPPANQLPGPHAAPIESLLPVRIISNLSKGMQPRKPSLNIGAKNGQPWQSDRPRKLPAKLRYKSDMQPTHTLKPQPTTIDGSQSKTDRLYTSLDEKVAVELQPAIEKHIDLEVSVVCHLRTNL